MVVRLMGLEEEAEAAMNQPSPFTDVPGWANGYINVAYAHGVSKGVGDGHFAPEGLCGVQDFITMLFRLTRLEEGKDWSWATAMNDFQAAVAASDTFQEYPYTNWNLHRALKDDAKLIYDEAVWGKKPLTRAMAADAMWLMMNIVAGPDGESLGDVLAEDYGMSDLLLYDNYVRRTAHGLRSRGWSSDTWDLDSKETDFAYIYAYVASATDRLDAIRAKVKQSADGEPALEYSQEIRDLADKLTAGKKTELEKAEAISTWVSTHIYYDYPELRSPAGGQATVDKQFFEQVLESRLAICDGYAGLTGALMDCVGLECYYEAGVTSTDHAWNVAYLDGKWVAMDNTYDSPLTYERVAGEGYAVMRGVGEYDTPTNIKEPNAVPRTIPYRYFGLDLDMFYSTHVFPREPLIVTDTVLTADSVVGTWRGNHRVDSY